MTGPTDPGLRDALHRLVLDSARRAPEAVAVCDGESATTYGGLDRLADRYAAALLARGARPGDRVLIWSEKSADAIALMQGALRIGACYVPVAPSNPPARVLRIAASCSPVVLAVDAERAGAADGGPELTTFAALLAEAPGASAPARYPSRPDDLAYILFTSGSTGEPKGVCLSHRNALAFVEWAAAETRLCATDRLSNHAPFNFDLSVFDLYGAFLAGASVDLVSGADAYAPHHLVDMLHRRGITVWYSVPSALMLMAQHGGLLERGRPPALRVCVYAGEPFPVDQLARLHRAWPGVRLLNWYGPTETNVCTSHEVTTADLDRGRPLPIGRASCGDAVRLDPPDAAEGEIVVDGPTVMLGYWGASAHSGPYRTGDLGRYDEQGRLEYVGRRDTMVKVRGHRIETGEIEAALAAHPDVAAVAVVVVGSGMEARLHAAVVPREDRRPTLLSLKGHCAARLPRYMIIDTVALLPGLPRTANGKTDRAALVSAAA